MFSRLTTILTSTRGTVRMHWQTDTDTDTTTSLLDHLQSPDHGTQHSRFKIRINAPVSYRRVWMEGISGLHWTKPLKKQNKNIFFLTHLVHFYCRSPYITGSRWENNLLYFLRTMIHCSPASWCSHRIIPNIQPLTRVWSLFSSHSLPSREFLINAKLVFLLIFELLRMGFWLWWADVVQAFPERDYRVLTSLNSEQWTYGQLGLDGDWKIRL